LRDEFNEVLTHIEELNNKTSPIDEIITQSINNDAYSYIQEAWGKALERRSIDSEGAITMARTLLETTFKHILEESNHEYQDNADLPQLYKGVQGVLRLAPSEHTEQVFKMILSGCISVVNGLGSLRNKLSDSHGKGQNAPKPSARHAQLAVNLAGSFAEFILLSWKERQEEGK
jgi:hypothetical protein